MRGLLRTLVAAALLFVAIAAISYTHAPGNQPLWAMVGGLSVGAFTVMVTGWDR